MNWNELAINTERNGFKTQEVLLHWQKLGVFRKEHPAVGAGTHTMLTVLPYTFKRIYTAGKYSDAVVVGLDLPKGRKTLDIGGVFANGAVVKDYYSGQKLTVNSGKVTLDSEWGIVLLGR
jgi:alpha-amylase